MFMKDPHMTSPIIVIVRIPILRGYQSVAFHESIPKITVVVVALAILVAFVASSLVAQHIVDASSGADVPRASSQLAFQLIS